MARKPKSGSDERAAVASGFQETQLAFLKVVVDHVAHPIFVKDRAHRWVWANRAFQDLIGFPREQTLGKTDHDFFPKEQADFFHEKDREVFASASVVVIEEEPITDASGEVHILATTKAPVRNPAGDVTHLVGIIHDITRRKQVEEALRLANQELEQRVLERTRDLRQAQNALLRRERLVVLGQLAGGLAHQIRHPLSVISNAAAIIRQRIDVSKDDDLRKALFSMAEEVREADRIISDLIDFARVREASAMDTTVGELVDAALSNMHVPAHVEVCLEISRDAAIRVDARQTRDALGNVLRNAVEAIGSVQDESSPEPERGRILVSSNELEPDFIAIRITDTGPGVAPGMVNHLFEPLVTDKTLGLGLGLCTARALIENQGGTLRYVAPRTADGTGACFEARLPRARD